MSFLDLTQVGKDESKSCVFAWPDRPPDTLPPDYPPINPPDCYPYCSNDDWPLPIIPPPDIPPFDDGDPPIITAETSTHIFFLHLEELFNFINDFPQYSPFMSVSMYRQTGVIGFVRQGTLVATKAISTAINYPVFGETEGDLQLTLRFWHKIPNRTGRQIYFFIYRCIYQGAVAIPPNGNSGISYGLISGAFGNMIPSSSISIDPFDPAVPGDSPYFGEVQLQSPVDEQYHENPLNIYQAVISLDCNNAPPSTYLFESANYFGH